jgi:MOSC domain-containing protein YiiM
MQLANVNIGRERPIQNAKASGKTGIYKLPVSERVRITSTGLTGDAICDTENHGGVDQAVYVYGTPDYLWWSRVLGRKLSPGTFGENLTITELESAQLYIGDRLHTGSVILEVTAPRIPCVTLATRMGDPSFVKRFREAERPGLYCRVIQEGYVQIGDPVALERHRGETIRAIELFRDFFSAELNEERIRRHLAAPIAIRARAEKEKKLGELLARKNVGSGHEGHTAQPNRLPDAP